MVDSAYFQLEEAAQSLDRYRDTISYDEAVSYTHLICLILIILRLMFILKVLLKKRSQLYMVIKRNRREARQYAFQMLYANEFHADQSDVQFPEGHIHKSMDKAYANNIINGVLSASESIDAALQPFCKSRKVENLDKVDRAILRIALWEMTNEDEPLEPSIAINEAIQLAKDFGSDSSYKLINAILDAYNTVSYTHLDVYKRQC